MAGDQGAIGIQELLFLFPELQKYDMVVSEKEIGYSTYTVYRFRINGIAVNENKYIDFVKQDNSYSLKIMIPKVIEEEKEENDKILVIKVVMPEDIDMANTMNYEGRVAEWELRHNDFTKDITLKAFTKIPE